MFSNTAARFCEAVIRRPRLLRKARSRRRSSQTIHLRMDLATIHLSADCTICSRPFCCLTLGMTAILLHTCPRFGHLETICLRSERARRCGSTVNVSVSYSVRSVTFNSTVSFFCPKGASKAAGITNMTSAATLSSVRTEPSKN